MWKLHSRKIKISNFSGAVCIHECMITYYFAISQKSSTHSHQPKCSHFELLSIDWFTLIELWTFIRNAHLKSSLRYLWRSMTLFTIRLHKLFYGYIILYGLKLKFVAIFLFIFRKEIRVHGHPYSIYCMYQVVMILWLGVSRCKQKTKQY